MATSIREYILENIQSALETINTSNGYNITVRRVERARITPFQQNLLPAIFLYEETDELMQEKSYCNDRKMIISCECWLKTHHNLSEEVNKLYADVQVALMTDRTRGSHAIDTKHTRAQFFIAEENLGGVEVTFEILYRQLPSDPTRSSL